MTEKTRTQSLVEWAISLKYTDLPDAVVTRTKELFADTLACAVAGRDHVAVKSMLEYAKTMGPENGKCEVIGFPEFNTSPAFAALVNGASAHVVEQDDLHNRSMMHPVPSPFDYIGWVWLIEKATVVFPTALAVSQDVNATGKDFVKACVVGYEVACRAGEFLGRAHYEVPPFSSLSFFIPS